MRNVWAAVRRLRLLDVARTFLLVLVVVLTAGVLGVSPAYANLKDKLLLGGAAAEAVELQSLKHMTASTLAWVGQSNYPNFVAELAARVERHPVLGLHIVRVELERLVSITPQEAAPASDLLHDLEESLGKPDTNGLGPPVNSPVGKMGLELKGVEGANTPQTISGIRYSGHALDQMMARGVPPSAVANTLEHGGVYQTRQGTVGYYDATNNLRVIVNPDTGLVVTVIPGTP